MSIDADYAALVDSMAVLPPVDVAGLYLPAPSNDGAYRDEFGFVFLADGSVGPFYVSLKPVLAELWRRFPRPETARFDPVETAWGLEDAGLPTRALALGAFNALSRRLMRGAAYAPPDRPSSKEVPRRSSDRPVGVVGYFCPVVDRLVASGRQVVVLEKQPGRVPARTGVRLTTRPRDLGVCSEVLCTASVLINDTLDEILEAGSAAASIRLIGPSGSGLPDALFERGIVEVGGIVFDDERLLRETLARGESWGRAGRKYSIRPADYPGVEVLLRSFADRGKRAQRSRDT